MRSELRVLPVLLSLSLCTADPAAALSAAEADGSTSARGAVPADIFWQYARRNLIREDIALSGWARNVLLEFRMAQGAWPNQSQLVTFGLHEPSAWATTWLSGIAVTSAGEIDVLFNTAAGGGSLQYRVRGDLDRSYGWWHCQSRDRADAGLLVPGCEYLGPGKPLAPESPLTLDAPGAEPYTASVLRRSIAEETGRMSRHLQVFIAEYFSTLGQWPTALQAGLAPGNTYTGRWVKDIQLRDAGILVLRLNADAGGGQLLYQPHLLNGSLVHWSCSSPDRSDIGRFIPGCVFQAGPKR